MRLDVLPDEETVFRDLAVVVKPAFEVRVALLDQRGIDLGARDRYLRAKQTMAIRHVIAETVNAKGATCVTPLAFA